MDTSWKDGKGRTIRGLIELKRIGAGTIVEIGGQKFLIGDINEALGSCGCCAEFAPSSIVSRYRKLDLSDPDLT